MKPINQKAQIGLPPGFEGNQIYIGERYVPIVEGTWDSTKAYEPLMIVFFEGNSYISRTYVPAGIPLTNTDYWALTSEYSAQIAAIQQQVDRNTGNIQSNTQSIENLEEQIQNLPYPTLKTSKSTNLKNDIESGKYNSVLVDSDVTISEPINIPSGIVIEGAGGTITADSTAFVCQGSTTLLTTIPAVLEQNDTQMTVLDASQIKIGDSLYLLGSESLINNDMLPDRWNLGSGTASITSSPLAVQVQVYAVNGNTVSFSPAIPWYMGGNIGVYAWNPAENIRFSNIKFKSNGLLTIQFYFADSCSVTGCQFKLFGSDGYGAIMASGSTNLTITNNFISVDDATAEQYYNNNYIRFTGCNRCLISGNTLNKGGQPIDITFNSVYGCSYYNIVSNNKIDALNSGMTIHPASFNCIVMDNIIQTQQQGIFARCRNHLISGNNITGNGAANAIGIVSSEGYGSGIQIVANNIRNCTAAFSLGGLATSGFCPNFSATIQSNKVENVRQFLTVYQAANSTSATIQVIGNTWTKELPGSNFETLLYVQGNNNPVTITMIGCCFLDISNLSINNGSNNTNIYIKGCYFEKLVSILQNNAAPLPNLKIDSSILNCEGVINTAFAYNRGDTLPTNEIDGSIFIQGSTPYIRINNTWKEIVLGS